ncbi:hypothetical protein RHS04_09321 [Rhizoctonia solani]|uniref:Uncharacterized protein n=1 Tax=Rhizoctonia solani TaxID=456999 RepID=A0A8H7H0H5_9AGAM|nr:hypothetical protein RHS04_09321 [Rhizoctonia solani]
MPTMLSSSIPGTPDGSDRDVSSPGTLPSGQPKRTQRIPENAQPYFAKLADKKKERANQAEVQKQKSEASAWPNAKQPTPIVEPSGKRRKGYLTNEPIDSSILNHWVEDLTTNNNKTQWYRAAIRQYNRKDIDLQGLELPELIKMFNNPQANKDELVDETNDKMQTCSVQDKPVASSTITVIDREKVIKQNTLKKKERGQKRRIDK